MENRAPCPLLFSEWSKEIILCKMAMELNVFRIEQLLSQMVSLIYTELKFLKDYCNIVFKGENVRPEQ